MHLAFEHAFQRAGDARGETELRLGRSIETSKLVDLLRQRSLSNAKWSQKGPNLAEVGGGTVRFRPAGVATAGKATGSGISSDPGRMDQESETIFNEKMIFSSLDPSSGIYGAPRSDKLTYLIQSSALGEFLSDT